MEKLGKDALRLKIKNKQELCEALEALDIQPNINAANMFVPTSNGVDESVNAEEHRGGLNAAVSDILWDVFGTRPTQLLVPPMFLIMLSKQMPIRTAR